MGSTGPIPVLDVSPFVGGGAVSDRVEVARELGEAARRDGFFYVVGHGVDEELLVRLRRASEAFFALDEEDKLAIRMARAGRAWRGYFPVGGELTSGQPDQKEGLYFGAELPPDDPRVASGTPLHGANLFPVQVPELRTVVLAYLEAMTGLGHALMEALAESLGLEASFFAERYTRDPLVLFRVFHYPSLPKGSSSWSVGEHTDYGLLTVLAQDDVGGLEVKSRGRWVDAPPVAGAFLCNLGDMLERMTGGVVRSTPHRLRNVAGRSRFSFPFFFDPGFDAEVRPIELSDSAARAAGEERWDGVDVHAFEGTYGEYLLRKVARVFPELGEGYLA